MKILLKHLKNDFSNFFWRKNNKAVKCCICGKILRPSSVNIWSPSTAGWKKIYYREGKEIRRKYICHLCYYHSHHFFD